jgi:hypothetical protein
LGLADEISMRRIDWIAGIGDGIRKSAGFSKGPFLS